MATATIDYLDKLNELQGQLGYNAGPINPIALFGLLGEAGEVLNETSPEINRDITAEELTLLDDLSATIGNAIDAAKALDSQKKFFRDRAENDSFSIIAYDETNFDKELADAFYYLLALARNRKLTINDLAKLSYEKVSEKLKNTPR